MTAEQGAEKPEDGEQDERSVVGLVADPGLAAELVDSIGRQLPGLLADWYDDESLADRWRVETSSELLPMDREGTLPLLEIGRRQRDRYGWDVTIVLSELPRRAGRRPILADCSPEAGAGLVSLPAMGAFRLRQRARDTIVYLIVEHLWADKATKSSGRTPGGARKRGLSLPYEVLTDLEERSADIEQSTDRVGEEAEAAAEAEAEEARPAGQGPAVHVALTGARGRLRLLNGMVRSNRPWRLVPSLSPALAGAAAGAAFGIFYSNIWQLADAFSTGRLVLATAVAVLANIVWLVFDNNLWERRKNRRQRSDSTLYNVVTAVTVSFGVLCMYLLLFTLTLLAAFVVIPVQYLATTLGHSSGVVDLATVAWLSASMGTIAGALGSGFAGEEAVRRAAYSERERERQERRDAEEERTGREATPAETEES